MSRRRAARRAARRDSAAAVPFAVRRIPAALLVALALLAPPAARAAVLEVPSQFPTIGAALSAASPFDVVRVAAGVYSLSTGETFPLEIATDGVQLLGDGMGLTILDAEGTAAVVRHDAAIGGRIAGFTITGGLATDGGGVHVTSGDVVIDGNLFTENGASGRGAGLLLEKAALPAIAPHVHHNVFWANFDSDAADEDDPHGVFLTLQVNGVVEHNLIARSDGNGLLANLGATPTIRHNIFLENGITTPVPRGRGICWLAGTPPRISHNLFFANVVAALLWPAGGGNMSGGFANQVSATDLIFGNLDGNPLLADADGGDYRLMAASPAIDAGDPTLAFDPDGTVADLGPFFFDQGNVGAPHGAGGEGSWAVSAAPNPFRAATTILFTLAPGESAVDAPVEVAIVDVRGRRVRRLAADARQGGTQQIRWDGRDESGASVAPGIYFARVAAAGLLRAAPIVRIR